jgi:hypothetical protein
MKRKYICLCTALALTSPVAAQAPPSSVPEQIEAMKSCAFLTGRWSGDGWISTGPGQRRTFHEIEIVESKLGGLLLLIQGMGTDPAGQSIHSALAVLSYDAAEKRHHFRAYEQMGHYTDAVPQCHDNVLTWALAAGPATIRYTIRLTPKGQWHELGMAVVPGAPEQQVFEMTLDKAAE